MRRQPVLLTLPVRSNHTRSLALIPLQVKGWRPLAEGWEVGQLWKITVAPAAFSPICRIQLTSPYKMESLPVETRRNEIQIDNYGNPGFCAPILLLNNYLHNANP